jgi:uncharacterized membrane protein
VQTIAQSKGMNFFIAHLFRGAAMVCERLHKVAKICPASQSRIIAMPKKIQGYSFAVDPKNVDAWPENFARVRPPRLVGMGDR